MRLSAAPWVNRKLYEQGAAVINLYLTNNNNNNNNEEKKETTSRLGPGTKP